MDVLFEASTWISLSTLILLEVVLGIDNLVFIAILAEKLPPYQREKARVVGISLAVLMRLGLLSIMTWIIQFQEPLFSILDYSFSLRDLIMIAGGVFLVKNSIAEIHERVDGGHLVKSETKVYAPFATVVAQIVVLDVVFSFDAVLTATHMAEHLWIMMLAVIISMAMMLLAANFLIDFLNRHNTVVLLCLSFLLMIGLSLIAEGLGQVMPKGYLYAAIGFSLLIEFLNQITNLNQRKREAHIPMRARTANAVLRMLDGHSAKEKEEQDVVDDEPTFGEEERNMVSGVLTLNERSLRSILTPRSEVEWIDLNDDKETIQKYVMEVPHNYFPLCKGSLDEVIGIARAKDIMKDLSDGGAINVQKSIKPPIFAHSSTNIIKIIELLREAKGQMVMITDEFGSVQGVITLIDVFEAIAGEFPDEDENLSIQELGEGHWLIEGSCDLHLLENELDIDGLVDPQEDFSSLAGLLLTHFGELPNKGDTFEFEHHIFTVADVDERRILLVDVKKLVSSENQY